MLFVFQQIIFLGAAFSCASILYDYHKKSKDIKGLLNRIEVILRSFIIILFMYIFIHAFIIDELSIVKQQTNYIHQNQKWEDS